MAAGYQIDETRRVVVILPGEDSSASDVAAVFDRILSDPRFGPDYQFISDRRGVVQAPTWEYVDKAVAVINKYRSVFGDRRWAILVDEKNLAMYGMGRVAEAFAEHCGITLRVVTTLGEALLFLRAGEFADDGRS